MRLDATIVFEPTQPMIENACRQLTSLGEFRVVLDNSTTAAAQERVDRTCAAFAVDVVRPQLNVGTGRGLNLLLREAWSRDLGWLHYLDQDSVLTGDYLTQVAELPPNAEDHALIGAVHRDPTLAAPIELSGLVSARFVISSGTLFNVSQVIRADGADERLFLDLVDHELCLRVRSMGMRVAVDTRRVLSHPIGEGAVEVGSRLTLWRHPAWRRELMWKNSWLLVREYATRKPIDCLRHLIMRFVETFASALVFRDGGYLLSAARGTRSAMTNRRRRTGYGEQDKSPQWLT
ncbi:hypothetical protein [Nocardioides sp. Soil774]|uniref:hypothetical protein n=1 Tax=Nocardioides sp. Soil774 TaxID=1736408 RepID=UPI000A581EA6|nr:hypothetical protein [Nocardioides sp. Soil774]